MSSTTKWFRQLYKRAALIERWHLQQFCITDILRLTNYIFLKYSIENLASFWLVATKKDEMLTIQSFDPFTAGKLALPKGDMQEYVERVNIRQVERCCKGLQIYSFLLQLVA